MKRVCNGVGCDVPVSICETMSVAVWRSAGEPVTTTLWLPASKLTLAVVATWPELLRRVNACRTMLATLVAPVARGRKIFVSWIVCERVGTSGFSPFWPTAPWTPLSTRVTSCSIWSSWPGSGAATMTRLSARSGMTRALVAAAEADSLAAATPGMAWRIRFASSSAFIDCG